MNRTNSRFLLAAAAAGLTACLGSNPQNMATPPTTNNPDNSNVPTVNDVDPPTGGGVNNTFNHPGDDRDPFDILAQKQEEGPPIVSTRMHSCQKMTYATLGHLLTSRGVDLGKTADNGMPPTAGQLYKSGGSALGAPNYLGRTREPTQNTTAGATKLMDVFMQAAPEIIAAMPGVDACKVNGQPTSMFNMDGSCNLDGISCLMGAPATAQHATLCNQLVKDASTPDIGRQVAVATILAAAHTCE
jgi:hypothetical protein